MSLNSSIVCKSLGGGGQRLRESLGTGFLCLRGKCGRSCVCIHKYMNLENFTSVFSALTFSIAVAVAKGCLRPAG